MSSKKKGSRHGSRKKDIRVSRGTRISKRIKSKNVSQGAKRRVRSGVQSTRRALDKTERAELRYALALVRKHIKGYGPKDPAGKDESKRGPKWRLSDLERITPQRRATVFKKAHVLRELLRQPHDLIRAPNRKARKSLVQFTRQRIPNAKHFIVHKPDDHFSVRLVHGRVHVRGEFRGKIRGKRHQKVVTESAFYLFPRAVRHPDDAEAMLRDMLAGMPEGFYVMLTGAHGDTGEAVSKGQLLTRLRQYVNAYQFAMTNVYDSDNKLIKRITKDQKFAQAIAGFRFLATSVDGLELQMQARDIRRQKSAEFEDKRRLDLMSPAEREAFFAPRTAEAKRQKRRAAAMKGWKTRQRKVRRHK